MEVKRTEQKFILNYKESLLLRRKLDAILPRDIHCTNSDGYEVRSLYFDTVTDKSCAEKEDGLQEHEKIRIRVYGADSSVIKLESKKKRGDIQTKQTMSITRQTMQALCEGNYRALLDHPDPLAIYFYEKLVKGMIPKAIIQYKRLSYCLPVNNTRITIDSDIRATECNFDLLQDPLQTHPILPADLVILEVKFNNFLLGYIKKTLSGLNQSTTSFSKYFSGRSFYRHLL